MRVKNQKKDLIVCRTGLLLTPHPTPNEKHNIGLGQTSACVWRTEPFQTPHSTAHKWERGELNSRVPGIHRTRIIKNRQNPQLMLTVCVCDVMQISWEYLSSDSLLSWEGQGNIWEKKGLLVNHRQLALEAISGVQGLGETRAVVRHGSPFGANQRIYFLVCCIR